MKATHVLIAAVCVILAFGAAAQGTVIIDTVPIGNPGNVDDTHGDGYGGVDYAYNISKFEVTAGQYCEFLNAVAATDTYRLYYLGMDTLAEGCQITQHGSSGSYTYDFSGGTVEAPGSTAADWANRPVSNVSWGDAARFANWLHNGQPTGEQDLTTTEDGSYFLNGAINDAALVAPTREPDATWVIPTEDEWYKAAYYDPTLNAGAGGYYNYPTGSDSNPSNDLIDPDPGNNANFDQSGYTIGSPYYQTEVGDFENSDSPYGTFDQGGNVWEWNEAIVDSSYRGLRGASFLNTVSFMGTFGGSYSWPTFETYTIGFRVAEIPEPATLGLLLISGLVLLKRRK